MPTSPIATFINHDLHNKFAIIRNATGMVEMFAEKGDDRTRKDLEKQTVLLNNTLDRLSASVINITNCMNLEFLEDDVESLNINYYLERLAGDPEVKAELKVEMGLGQIPIHENKFLFIIKTVIDLIGELSPGAALQFAKGDGDYLMVFFQDDAGNKNELKNVRDLLQGKLKPESLPHQFNIFFANYLLQKRGGGIFLEYIEPGVMAVKLRFE
jgi:hypothetical protein